MVPEPGPANTSTPDWGLRSPSDPGGSVWVAAAMCVVIALTAAANSLLIALICTQPALRNTSNFFLVSLFTSDLMVGLVVMPPAMLNALYGRWVLARSLCLLWAAFDVMCCSASILNLCLISLDRYLLILSPLRYKLRMTSPRALALVLGAWSLAALTSFLPLLLGWHELGRVRAPAPGQCRLLASLPFVLVASGLTFFLPSGAICFTYCRILLAARKQAVQVASLTTGMAGQVLDTLQVPRTPHQGVESADSRRLATKHSRKALKASLTLGILLGMFFVTWLPFFVANIAQAVCDCVPPGLFDVLTWLGYCNSTMNPIIYPLFMRDFKRALGRFLPCLHCAREHRASPASPSMRTSHSGPRPGLSLQQVLPLPLPPDSDSDSGSGGSSGLQLTAQLLLPGQTTRDPPPPARATVNFFNIDPVESELRLHPLGTPTH
ncbi:PREDICTED: 5-hydroxytryptamine receptor 6 [Condylura cristata]|uniref:5-hydroxytryptamine receptor 6 n=1 Tax=Condylura cristata TaxID=143302 RepID=UPI00033470A1|nr:PREDICTED: 5-hydroxytryptamine receptor 6 [Condylura cristata]XP_012578118.1 PREDICTED: 5-hydroxytryptamine receptor 6 [Condylura cristata]